MGGIATIGVRGWDPEEFLGALTGAAVGVVLDLRDEVDGGEYAWADPERLPAALAETGIEYRQLPGLTGAGADLAPLVALAERTLPALLCVERDPEACNRGLIAARLEVDHGLEPVHFRPLD